MLRDIIEKNAQIKASDGTREILRRYFPGCFDSKGNFDLDRFRVLVSDEVDIRNEGYALNFLGKSYARLLASVESTTVIVPDTEHNSRPENVSSKNIYITGDNLDALKHLLKSYYGQVKCIYIDPPYNTGSDGFVYNDNFSFTSEELQIKLGISQEQADKILDLTKRGSASHSAWLMFMMPRLQLARDLLSDDGVIFISIDDNEQANLKLLCDSIFGEENFEANIAVVVNPGGRDYKQVAITNEYLLVYSQEKAGLNEITREGEFQFVDSTGGYNVRELRNRNPRFNRGNRPNLFYPFYVNPNISYEGYCAVSLERTDEYCIEVKPYNSNGEESVWRWGRTKSESNIVLGDLDKSQVIARQKRDGGWNVYEKNRRATTKIKSLWDDTEMRTENGTRELRALFGKTYFDHPKPVDLIKRCFTVGSDPGDLVIDFFAGSSTSAQAILELNAESGDELSRSFIMVQLPEVCRNETALKDGYSTIDKIGMRRIDLAADKIRRETGADIDYGFKHYTLKEPSDRTLEKLELFDPSVEFFADGTVLEEFGPDSVLETWQVRDGYGLGAESQPVMLDTYTARFMDKHLYMIDTGFTEDDMAVLMEKYLGDKNFNPENIVLLGYSFTFAQTEMLRKNLVTLRDAAKNLRINIDIRY